MALGRGREDGQFFFIMVAVSALIIFAGFAPSFYLKSIIHAPPPLSPLTIVHGIVFTAWVLFVVLQSALIGFGDPALHRRLGVLGAVLFGSVVTLGLSTAITAAKLGHAPPGAPAPMAFLALPMFDIAGVAVLVVLALANRTRLDFHKRLMMCGLVAMTPPGLGRILIGAGQAASATSISFLVMDLLLAGAVAYDAVVHRRIHPAYFWCAAIFFVMNVGVAWGFTSPEWLSFAQWLTR